MSWIRSFFESFKGLWRIPDGGKVADRPHPLTVVIGILGPVATVTAVTVTGLFAYRSWQTSQASVNATQQAMRVSQRAYVITQKSKSSMLLIKASRSWGEGKPETPSLVGAVQQSFEIKNLGRTPAKLKELVLRFYLPKDWWTGADARDRYTKDGDWWVYRLPLGYDVGQDTEAQAFENAYSFSLSDHAVAAYQSYLKDKVFADVNDFVTFSSAYPAAVDATLIYTDVFEREHYYRWRDEARLIEYRTVMATSR